MNEKQFKTLDYTAKHSNYEVLNSQFIKARCYVMASGRNANGSDITLEAMQKCIPQLGNTPVVAHLYKKADGTYRVGGHDSKIEITDEGIDFTDLTVPFGVIPENCEPEIVEVLEPDGITKNHYLVCSIILWVGRYPIMDASYSDDTYFNQSCELMIDRYYYTDDGVFTIEDFTLSALCLLNKSDTNAENVQPCFPSCRVEKLKYSLEQNTFKEEFAILMQEIKTIAFQDIKKKKEENKLDYTTNKDAIFSRIKEVIATNTYRANTGKHYAKYEVYSIDETSVNLVDREDHYKVYSVPYFATETADGIVVNFDYDKKEEKSFAIGEKTEEVFGFDGEVKTMSKDLSDYDVAQFTSTTITDLKTNLKTVTDDFNAMKDKNVKLTEQLEVFEKEKAKFAKSTHKNSIDTIINTWSQTMGKDADFLEYSSKVDYDKSIEQIETEIKDIHYNFMLKCENKNKSKFSAIDTEVIPNGQKHSSSLADEYGDDLAKFL